MTLKKFRVIVLGVLLVFCAAMFIACDDSSNDGGGDTPDPDTNLPDPNLNTITGVSFNNKTVVYNGNEHALLVEGDLPNGVTVEYSGNRAVNAGTYNATAKLSGTGYNTLTLSATLTVNKAEITGITMQNVTAEYDTLAHSTAIVGNLPVGTSVSYTVGKSGESPSAGNSAVEVGTYTVTATITGNNHNTLTLTATLKITASDEQLYSTVHNGAVYFQNNLDGNKLYKYNGTDVNGIGRDVPQDFTSIGTDLYYVSKGLLSSTIKKLTGTTSSQIYNVAAEYLITDGTYLYYAVNHLLGGDKNGIYQLDVTKITDDSYQPAKLTAEKASYLVYANGVIYYSNESEGGKLYKISTSARNGTGTLVHGEKSTNLLINGSYIYFNQEKLLGNALYRKGLTTGDAEKLTTDSGKNLCIIGTDLFYINTDNITGAIFGKGVYKISIGGEFLDAPGTKIVDAEVSSLASDGSSIYYYKRNNKHFYKNALDGQSEVDLMATYVVDSTVNITGYTNIKAYKNEVYYANPLDGGAMYKVTAMGQKIKLFDTAVADFWFDGDYMYYSSYVATNYALWRMDVTNFGEPQKLTGARCEKLIFIDDYIYCIQVKAVGNNKLSRIKKDGSSELENLTHDGSANFYNLEKVDDVLYFVANIGVLNPKATIVKYDLTASAATTTTAYGSVIRIDNGTAYICNDGAIQSAPLSNLASLTTLVSGVEGVTELCVAGNRLYYANQKSGSVGLYALDLTTKASTTVSSSAASGLTVVGSKLYYFKIAMKYANNYPSYTATDGELYCCALDGSNEARV